MVLDHIGDNSCIGGYCRQPVTLVTRTTDCLCGFTDSAVETNKTIQHEFFTDMGRNNYSHFNSRLPYSCLGYKAVWWHTLWRMGMHIGFYSRILDGAMGRHTRTIHWRFC